MQINNDNFMNIMTA